MAKEEITIQNFSAGELSPKMFGRYELAVAKAGCRKMRNFIADTQGPARFRTGFRVVHYTRGNKVPYLIPFQFNDQQSYQLEFTDKKLRFHKDEGVIVESDKTITGITKANPGVVTSNSHGYANGDEVFIYDVVGMTEVNGKSFIVANKAANTFELKDIDGNNVNTTNYTTYSSGGVANRIYELTTPYDELLDLTRLRVTQNADTMYIDHPFYDSRKLTRTGHTSWTLSRYTRTDDPFLEKKVITGVTQANPGVVTSVGHGYVTGDIIIIEEIVGMTELNSRVFNVVKINNDTFSLVDYITDVAVNTTGYTAYSSAGFASDQTLLPSCLAFFEGRLFHGGATDNPTQFIGSMSPNPTDGTPRPDVFTAGTDADDAVYFSIADGEVNAIRWLIGTNRLLMAGTFGTEVRIAGESSDKPITPSSINVRSENRLGVADVPPINKENIVIYVQRGNLTLRSFEFDAITDSFISVDRNLVADHVTKSGIKQICWITGRPDMVVGVTNDGRLLGLTFKSREEVSGWHAHDTGGAFDDLFLSCSPMPRPTQVDQLWVATERVIDGHTRRFIEFQEDEIDVPDFFDFFTDDDALEANRETFWNAVQEVQKDAMHLDCAVTYDGTSTGSDASASATPSAVTGTGITITASAAVFKASDVGREIWKKSITGFETGRATITAFTNSTHVVCTVTDDFDNTDAIAAGDWYLTTDSVTNLDYLEGREVAVVTDGGVHPSQTVVDGAISLDYQSSKVHVGLAYIGFLQPMSLEAGGTTGPAQTKNKNVNRADIRFLNTLGAEFGTDPYDAEELSFDELPLQVGAPQVLFSGIKSVSLSDSWNLDKTIFIRQRNSLPCQVQLIEVFAETDNE